MIDEELQLHSWREVLDYRVKSLLGSIAQEKDWLLKDGANEEEIREALRHQYEILHKIYSEDYPDLDAYGDVVSVVEGAESPISYRNEATNSVKRARILHQVPHWDLLFS